MAKSPNMIEVMRALPEAGQLVIYRDAIAKNDAAMQSAVELANPGIVQRQLPEHTGCGKLFKHRLYNPDTGRVTIKYTGDSKVWRDAFSAKPVPVKFMSAATFDSFETKVQTGRGERIAVTDDDGNILRYVNIKSNM